MSIMQGIESDVRFNHVAASTLARRCRNAANAIEGQATSRSGWVAHALADFLGYYSELFRGNGRVQASDARLLVARLREVAERAGCRAVLLQRAADIDWSVFEGVTRLGITAGASAPEVLVEEVIDAFAERFEVSVEVATAAEEAIAFNLPRGLRDAAE